MAIQRRLVEYNIKRRTIKEATKGLKNSEEHNKKIAEAKRNTHLSEETKEKLRLANLNKKASEKTKAKMSKTRKGRRIMTDEHYKMLSKKFSGPGGSNWRGGSSYQGYCPKFNRVLKEQIRDEFGRACFTCDKTEEKNGHKLSVHHCDYNKGQGCGKRWSLLPLCRRCHNKSSMNRHYWFNMLSNFWALGHMNGIEGCCFYPNM